MAAYALKQDSKLHQGSCNDREYGASVRIKNLIFKKQAKNTAIFVIRKFGGLHLGFEWFKVNETVATEALEMLGI